MLTHTDWLQGVFDRQDAVQKHAATLSCPACGHPGQNQIMNQACQGEPFEWRCRMCRHRFTSGQQ